MAAHWLFLLLAIASEVAGTVSMKLSVGFTKPVPSVFMFVCYGISLMALTLAIKRIEVSVAYAIWSGLGTVLISSIGIVRFGEGINSVKVISILLVILGVVGLNLSSSMR